LCVSVCRRSGFKVAGSSQVAQLCRIFVVGNNLTKVYLIRQFSLNLHEDSELQIVNVEAGEYRFVTAPVFDRGSMVVFAPWADMKLPVNLSGEQKFGEYCAIRIPKEHYHDHNHR
jgi:hypothetical protein